MSVMKMKHVPTLRFPEFTEPWKTSSVDSFVKRYNNPVAVEPDCMYRQIGVRSHGKGIFHKEPVTGKSLGEKRVFWVHPQAFVVNIVFGWEQAVALTSDAEEGFIASHRFPMFVPVEKKTDLNFLLLFFLRKRGKYLLGLASPGGAGRNKTLGQNEFAKLDITLPILLEQQKIATFVGAIDNKLEALRRQRELLQTYKRGMLQKIFSHELRFKADDGSEFPEWKNRRLRQVLVEHGEKCSGKEKVFSVSVARGLVNQIEHLGRSFSAKETSHYNLAKPGDVIYTKSPTGNFPFGIIKQSKVQSDVIVSPLYGVFTPETPSLGYILDAYFAVPMYTNNFLKPIVQKGAKNTINITNKTFLTGTLKLPVSHIEQQKIADFLSAIDAKIDAVAGQIEKMQQFKKGLLQQMFV